MYVGFVQADWQGRLHLVSAVWNWYTVLFCSQSMQKLTDQAPFLMVMSVVFFFCGGFVPLIFFLKVSACIIGRSGSRRNGIRSNMYAHTCEHCKHRLKEDMLSVASLGGNRAISYIQVWQHVCTESGVRYSVYKQYKVWHNSHSQGIVCAHICSKHVLQCSVLVHHFVILAQ